MSNIIQTTGYHTCEQKSAAYLRANAPFLSVCKKEDGEWVHPYFGEGYYLWDNNIEAAHEWGKKRYKGTYSILSYDLVLKSDDGFLDLVGCTQDLQTFYNLYRKLLEKQKEKGNRTPINMGAAIDMLRKIHSKNGVFPYKVIRAQDCNASHQTKVLLTTKSDIPKINLTPKFYICYFDKNDIPLETVKIIKQ